MSMFAYVSWLLTYCYLLHGIVCLLAVRSCLQGDPVESVLCGLSTLGDTGFFGGAHLGVYVGRCINYVAKYSNNNQPLKEDESVKVLVLKAVPGRERYLREYTGPISLTDGYDSHLSPAAAEWFLSLPYQTLPCYILTVKAVVRSSLEVCDDC